MRKVAFIIIVLCISAIYYFSISKGEQSIVQQGFLKIQKMVKNSTSAPAPAVLTTTAVSNDSTQNLETLNTQDLKTWINTEARAMDSTANNTDEALVKIKAQARSISHGQLVELTQLALNPQQPANSRIFAAYLLNLSELPESQSAMFALAKSALPDTGPVVPHSEAEVKHGQELAIRYMQVDELFNRAKSDPDALDKLKALAGEADSERVRTYSQKKLQELKK